MKIKRILILAGILCAAVFATRLVAQAVSGTSLTIGSSSPTTVTNIRCGTISYSGSSATVYDSAVTANTRIFVGYQDSAGANNATWFGSIGVSSRSAGTSFTLSSSKAAPVGGITVAYLMIEP